MQDLEFCSAKVPLHREGGVYIVGLLLNGNEIYPKLQSLDFGPLKYPLER